MKIKEFLIESKMSLSDALEEWQKSKRRMGCVAATKWLCDRVEGFYPVRLGKYTKNGDYYEHVVASNGNIRIDLAPYSDLPKNYNQEVDGNLDERK